MMHFREALHDYPKWKPLHRQGPRIELVPAVTYKFLDIGTRMGEYHIEELIPRKDDKDNILHPRHTRPGIPSAYTFHSIVQNRVGSQYGSIQQWCSENAWFESSPKYDFWVADPSNYRWGLPVLVPTCPKKVFMQGPRLKYIDIVTDTLHASSSDLITWNTLVMLKLRWFDEIPRQWLAITTHSLEAWKERDQLSQFHDDTRRGYARLTLVALSHIGVPGSTILHADEYPQEGLGVYDDYETCAEFNGYIWATWTTKAAQPMQIDSALQALLNPSAQTSSGQKGPNYDMGTPANVDAAAHPTGSNEHACGSAAPYPDSVEDVSMDSGVDKRSRESPDSTLKPEGKSLKTSGATSVATTSDTIEVSTTGNVKPSNVTKRPTTVPEAKSLMWEVHHRMPAWKAEKLIECHKSDQVDLAVLGEATGIMFESKEMLNEAVEHLVKIRKEKGKKEDADLGVPKTSDPQSSQNDQEMSDDKRSDDLKEKKKTSDPQSSQNDQEMSDDKRSDDLKEQKETNSAPTGAAIAVPKATGDSSGAVNQDSKSSSKTPDANNQQQDANASSTDAASKEKTKPVSESHEDWFSRVTKAGQEVLWYPKALAKCPTLLTGVQPSDLKSLETLGWEDKLESADLKKQAEYLRGRQFVAEPHPLEATAWENGFVPETKGLPPDELEQRTLPLLPQLSHMVSAPRQPAETGNALLTRFDANIRPYWLRDWQSGFGGYTKVYEYQCDSKTKRMYSVAHVVRPRTATSEACLCFTLMEAMPSNKPCLPRILPMTYKRNACQWQDQALQSGHTGHCPR